MPEYFSFLTAYQNNILYILLHFAIRTNEYVYKYMNQRHLKTPLCYYCKKPENITHLFIDLELNQTNYTPP